MKILPTLIIAAAAASFTLTGCDKKPAAGGSESKAASAAVAEKQAIANFKAEVDSVGAWYGEKQKSAATDPAAGKAVTGELIGKLQGIKTDGLPVDLKEAWSEMGAVLRELGDLVKVMPTPKSRNPDEAMKAMREIMPKMMATQAKLEPIAKKLEELGTKYGIDLSKAMPGK